MKVEANLHRETQGDNGVGRRREHQGMLGTQEANGRQRRKAWRDMLKIH